MTHNGKDLYLGRFNTAEEAAKAYANMAKKLHGEFLRPEVRALG
jgi:hypothetical protein